MRESKWLLALLAGTALGAAIVGGVWILTAGDKQSTGGQVELSFEPGPRRDEALLRRELEHARETLNRDIRLPRDLRIRLVGEETAARVEASGPTYVPEDHTVYFPWSFVEQSRSDLGAKEGLLRETVLFALLHELTHGFIDELDLPIVGGEERAADSLAAIFAIRSGRTGAAVALSGAALDEAEAKREGPPGIQQYADDHELDAQREIDVLCLVYGSDEKRFRRFVDQKRLPRDRAEICRFDYSNELRSWRRLLDRWLTGEGGLSPRRGAGP